MFHIFVRQIPAYSFMGTAGIDRKNQCFQQILAAGIIDLG
jgi:hypothetical protein